MILLNMLLYTITTILNLFYVFRPQGMSGHLPSSEINSKGATNSLKMSIDTSKEKEDASPHDTSNFGHMDVDSSSDFDTKKWPRETEKCISHCTCRVMPYSWNVIDLEH